MRTLDIIFCLIGSCLISYSESGRIRRVINGSPVARGDWPFLVSLSFNESHPFKEAMGLPHLCAGTLIRPNLVLTAAHCFQVEEYPLLSDTRHWQAVIGEHHREANDRTEQTVAVESITYHKDFTILPTKNDIAILKLARPVDVNDHVNIINLDNNGTFQRDECKVIGWGQDDAVRFGHGTYVPHEADLSLVETNRCNATYASSQYSQYFDIDDTILCATGNGERGTHDACLGDSGGPLVCKRNNEWIQTGIVSGGIGCGNPDYPGLYTRLESQANWINTKLATLTADVNSTK